MALQFLEKDHRYVSTDGADIDWISATSLISYFKKPFDGPTVAAKSSKKKNSKWYGMNVEDILAAWKAESERATTLGTWYHNEREKDICGLNTLERWGKELHVTSPVVKDGIKQAPDQRLVDGIYPEHLVYLKSAGVCGQSDLVEVADGIVHITDYKSNKELKTEGYKDWEGNVDRLSMPLRHLQDCHLTHYTLQLSLYMFIILKHNPHLKPGKLIIHHILFEEEGRDKFDYPIYKLDAEGNPIVKDIVPYELPYLKTEILSLVNWLKSNRQKVHAKKKLAA